MADECCPWTFRQLRAAFWVGHVLGPAGEDEHVARASFAKLPAEEVDLPELHAAQEALLRAKLIRRDGTRLVPDPRLAEVCLVPGGETEELLLALVLECSQPLWLQTATAGGDRLSSELIPADVDAVLAKVIPDPIRREAFLLARARTVDAHERQELAAAGEDAVVAFCREELRSLGDLDGAAAVRRVSLVSDELGYDVTAPRLDGSTRRLEVKATRSTWSNVSVVVTRNEMTVASADPDWALVLVRVGIDPPRVLGWVDGRHLEPLLPADRHELGRWQAARLRLSLADLTPDVPSA